MPTYAVAVTVGAYAAVTVLLLSLNIASLWRWPIKAAAIFATTGLCVGSYLTMGAVLGWPTGGRLPERASFLASRIVEPDKLTGDPGAIFVWLQGIDNENLPVGEPRAYEIAYSRAVATEVVKAQRLRLQGRDVVGNFDYSGVAAEAEAPLAPRLPVQKAAELHDAEGGGRGGDGVFSLTQDLHASFEEMPPLPLPDKSPLIDDSY